MRQVFVYGSLRPGRSNYSLLETYVQETVPAHIPGLLYHMPTGYPTVIYPAEGKVYGELLQLEPFEEILAMLDEFEDYYGPDSPHNEYQRIKGIAELETGQQVHAYLYVCPGDKINRCTEVGTIIPSGDWQAFLRERGEE